MGLLQGPRLMARTTKSPIQRNHWVPLGCRGHLGSVKMVHTYVHSSITHLENQGTTYTIVTNDILHLGLTPLIGDRRDTVSPLLKTKQ